MAKSRDELASEGYRDFHHFGSVHLYSRLFLALILYIALLMIVQSIFDQDFVHEFRESLIKEHCHGIHCRRGLGMLILFGFFLTTPLWFKLPVSALFGSSWSAKLFSRIYKSMDSKPDLAIGSPGIYFPKNLHYSLCGWNDVSRVTCVKAKSKHTGKIITRISLFGHPAAKPSKWSLNPSAKPLILEIPDNWGMDGEAILTSIKEFALTAEIEVIDLTQPQKNLK